MTSTGGQPEQIEGFAAIARYLDTGSVHDTLQRTVDLAVESIPACGHAGISIVHGRKITTPAASDHVALRVDALQSEVGEGPCLDAIVERLTFKTDDLTKEERWPRFATRAHVETGVTSILALRLFAREQTIGALNLFSVERAAFDEDAIDTAVVFASIASAALAAAQREEGLLVALGSRDVIGQAKGILMERHKVGDDDAFQMLVRSSQYLNQRLAGVAADLVTTRDDPDQK